MNIVFSVVLLTGLLTGGEAQTVIPRAFDEATFDADRSQVVADKVIRAIAFARMNPVNLGAAPNDELLGFGRRPLLTSPPMTGS